MKLKVTHEKECARFALSGDLDEKGADILDKGFRGLNQGSLSELVLDFKDVAYIGSSAIGQLILFYKILAASGGKIRIENVSGDIYDLLLDLDINKLISISK
ncbi:STAS domain-containing protein [Desulfonema magnum]|uniref:STAS domain-containing protein n=1 Tax=Desulfonema magnum TaxID=45655 RepID=A0A975GKU0_9BACT|nr:STAS domain-containing protein [Desulfonema magnum]QTA85106.1 STAS domain-containing protein [Desulfonema magnum]